jgi:hypothetical protein
MLHYARVDLKSIPGDGRSIGENVEKSICARWKTVFCRSLAGIPAHARSKSAGHLKECRALVLVVVYGNGLHGG